MRTSPAREFEGRTVLVTGGSRGIGKAVARAFHEAGARVVICGRNPASLVSAAREIGEIICIPADVRRDARRLVRRLGGRLDILVNNAGGMEHHGTFERTPLSAWRSTFELNLFSAVEVTREALPLLRRSPAGCVVNIASDVGRRPFHMGPDYCAAKAALIHLTRYLAAELAPVRVNAVCPGPVATGDWSPRDVREAARRTLLGRTGRPEEVAHAVLFAARATFLTGAVVGVDGGAARTP
ncbi:MAG TPA: SDR family oxidoreductase [Planctomycetota bacterium]|nr:SDR family oxidoreductase [Planctomycetota bacterium]